MATFGAIALCSTVKRKMMDHKNKLKDTGTCRIFFSSPFGGMEEEREELTKKYFPQIHHACNAKGIKFVPVDMRWGITKEAAENAQVMNICLREVERSDFFAGFFGQRYGWHSAHSDDSILVQNFEEAAGAYPWVNNFKDRSMTEIECRAGHLNNPGFMPSCFCFREKAYDDKMKEEGLRNNDMYQVNKFTIENEHADRMRADLIQEVIDTQDKTWGVKLDCKDPQEIAKFLFDTLWKFLTEVVLKDLNEVEVPYMIQQRLVHDQFVTSASHIYCGCEDYLQQLTNKIIGPPTKGTVVRGKAGCGKSALLAKWMRSVQQAHPHIAVIYHFIGCAPGTERPRNILERILLELRESFPSLNSKTPAPGDNSANDKNNDSGETSNPESSNTNEEVSNDSKQPNSELTDQITKNVEKEDNSNNNDADQKDVNVECKSDENTTQENNNSNSEEISPSKPAYEAIATNICIVPKMSQSAKDDEKKENGNRQNRDSEAKDKVSSAEDKTSSEDKSSLGENKTSETEKDSKNPEPDSNSPDNSSDSKDKKDDNDEGQQKEKEEGKEKKSGLEKKTTQQILSEVSVLMGKISEEGHKVVIILDALNQQKATDKTIKHLYWLPETFPENIRFVCSTLDTDTASYDLLVTQRGMDELVINPFDSQLQQMICVETLKVSGKELSPHQLERVVNAKETSNALFLKLVLYELSIYGSFSQLDNKIDSLIYVSGVKPLLQVILERLEMDYCSHDYQGNLVKDVLCCLIASRKGVSETELTEILDVPAHLWSPLFFALEHLLSQYTGLLGFAFSEMRDAVIERYLSDMETQIIPYKKKLIKYYDGIRKTMIPWIKSTKPEQIRTTEELPYLQVDIKDTQGLIQTLSDLSILRKLASNDVNGLLYLWQQTSLPWSAVSNLYMKSFDMAVSDLYQEWQSGALGDTDSPGMKIRVTLQHMRVFFDAAYYSRGCQKAMEREIKILETCKTSMSPEKHAEYLRDSRYYLAMSYSEQQDTEKALPMYLAIEKECRDLMKDSKSEQSEVKEMLAFCSNGIGLIYYYHQDYAKAEEYLMTSKNLHKEMGHKMHEGASTTNLGLTYLGEKKYNKALEFFHEAMQLYEDHYFGKISLDTGNLYTNIALTYRRMKNLDKAEEFYHKSLEMKAMNVGWNHPVIATAYMNLGTLEVHRKNYPKSEEWTRKAIRIYEVNEAPVTDKHHRMCRENLCVNMLKQGKKKELLPLYIEITHILVDGGWMDEAIVSLHREMLELMLDKKMYDEVEKFVLAILASSKRRARFAHILADLDARRAKFKKTIRPPDLTLESFMKEYPNEGTLKILYVTSVLAKSNAVDEILPMCDNLHKTEKNLQESAYSFAAEALNDCGFSESALKVAKCGLEKYPDNVECVSEAVKSLLRLQRPDELVQYVPVLLASLDSDSSEERNVLRVAKELRNTHPLVAGKCFQKLTSISKANFLVAAKQALMEMFPDGLPPELESTAGDGVQSKDEVQTSSDITPEKEDSKPSNTNGAEKTFNGNEIASSQNEDVPIPNLFQHQSMAVGQNHATPSDSVSAQDNEQQMPPNFILHQAIVANQMQEIQAQLNDELQMPSHQAMSASENYSAPSDSNLLQNNEEPPQLFIAHQAMSASGNHASPFDSVSLQNNEELQMPSQLFAHQAMSVGENHAAPSDSNLVPNNEELQQLLVAHQAMNVGENSTLPSNSQNNEDSPVPP